jgi:phenylacetate-CoA ligase
MSSYHLGPATVDQYLDEIEEFAPHFIDGYPSSIVFCAKGALDAGRDIRIPACFPTAETLRPNDRNLIEEAFSTKVFNQYGSAESASLVTECVCGRLHVNPDIGIVEVVDEEGYPVSGDEVGELVLTGLNNRAMPLIRYQIGDLARGKPRYVECDCGWETPVISELIGREDEMIITTDGRRIPMLSYNVFKYVDHVEKSQIVQDEIGKIKVKVVPKHGYDRKEESLIEEKIKEAITDRKTQIEVVKIEGISKTSSGKFRAVVCNV